MTAHTPAPDGARVGDLLQAAARLFRASLLKCLPLGMIALLCAQVPNIYWVVTGHAIGLYAQHDANFDLLMLIGTTLELWFVGAMMLRQRAVALHAPIVVADELRTALRLLPGLLLGWLLATLSVIAGVLLLLVPGVFLMVCFLVLLPVILFEGLGPVTALVRSVRLVRPLWWQAFAALVIAVLLAFIGAVVFAAIIAAIAGIFEGDRAAVQAIETAGIVGFGAVFFVFLSALSLVLHSVASSSA